MSKRVIRLTEAEWTLMEELWSAEVLTGREATDRMAEKLDWNRSTTLTHLRRMEEKGAIRADSGAGVKRYRPAVSRDEAARQEAESFLDRVYQGSVSMMVSALTKKQSLPREEIDELYALLDRMEGERHDGMDH